MTIFYDTDASILTPCSSGTVHTYVTSKELKKIFLLNGQDIITNIGIQLTFTL